MLSLQNCMMAAERFFELAYFECRISKARQAVRLALTLHLQAVDNSFTSYSWRVVFSARLPRTTSLTCFTMSSQRSVCYAILANCTAYTHSLLIYIMQCHCRDRQESERLEQTVLLLEELLQSERNAHLLQLKALKETVTVIAVEKDERLAHSQTIIEKMGKKLEQYKMKNEKLAEKVKQQGDTVKAMTERQFSLECETLKTRQTLQKERKMRNEEGRYIGQLKQTIALQELQNKELSRQNQLLTDEITYLQQEIASYAQIKNKFGKIDEISQEQYQKQISLLKTSLQQEFTRKTDQLFSNMTHKQPTIEHKDIDFSQSQPVVVNRYEEELKLLASFADYGRTYFDLQNEALTLPQSKKIFKFIKNLNADLHYYKNQLNEERMASSEMAADLKQKMEELQLELRNLSQKQCINTEVQTNDFGRLSQQSNLNNSLRLKNYELIKIISFITRFAVYCLNCSIADSTKKHYYRFTEAQLYRKIKPKRKNLRQYCTAVLFIQFLAKGAKRRRRLALQERFEKESLSKYVQNNHLVGKMHRFWQWEKGRIDMKNHKIEQLTQNKPEANPHQKIIQILNQESLNQGTISINYSSVFSRFIMETLLKR